MGLARPQQHIMTQDTPPATPTPGETPSGEKIFRAQRVQGGGRIFHNLDLLEFTGSQKGTPLVGLGPVWGAKPFKILYQKITSLGTKILVPPTPSLSRGGVKNTSQNVV